MRKHLKHSLAIMLKWSVATIQHSHISDKQTAQRSKQWINTSLPSALTYAFTKAIELNDMAKEFNRILCISCESNEKFYIQRESKSKWKRSGKMFHSHWVFVSFFSFDLFVFCNRGAELQNCIILFFPRPYDLTRRRSALLFIHRYFS